MDIWSILGIIGTLLYFLKIIIHFIIKRSLDKNYSIGNIGQYTEPELIFLPINDEVGKNLRLIKKIGNIIFPIAILLIVVFLIGDNLNKKPGGGSK